MHEMGLAEGIVDVACGLAGPRRVRRVTVRVGALQRVAEDSLQFGFEMLAAGTSAADAVLEVRHVDGDVVLVDEVELDGEPPHVLRRPGLEVVEAPHDDEDHRHLVGRGRR